MNTTDFLKAIYRDRTGATAIEYGLIASLVVIAMIVALQGVAGENTNTWGIIEDKTTTAMAKNTGKV